MKLYEAMLKGAKMGPQAFGSWSDGSNGSCAMGAVMLGCGFGINYTDWYEAFVAVRNLYPELRDPSSCPVHEQCKLTYIHEVSLMDVIMHLNDKHQWSRQRIAEWLSGTKTSSLKKMKAPTGEKACR